MKINGLLLILFVMISFSLQRRNLPHYDINLDLEPEERFIKVVTNFKPQLLQNLDNILGSLPWYVRLFGRLLGSLSNINNEIKREMHGIAKHLEVSYYDVALLNLFYETTTIDGMKFCLGAVMKTDDGEIYHGRNLDLPNSKLLSQLLYDASFYKGDKFLFTAQMLAGYQGIVSGVKFGMFGISQATRSYTSLEDSLSVLYYILKGNKKPTFLIREILENLNSYEEAKNKLFNESVDAPIYYILSGLTTGSIIARDPEKVVYLTELENNKIIIQTNYDTNIEDPREKDDPRRLVAEQFFKSIEKYNRDTLFEGINHEGVADEDETIWQGIYSAQANYWYSTSPN